MSSLEMNHKSEEPEDDPNIEVSEKFWGNDVIWREITGYLNISDLKEFSRVSKYYLSRVRSLTRFVSLAGQVVTGEMKIHTFKLSRAIVEVNEIDEKALKDLAPTIFQDTEYLELHSLGVLSDEDRNSRLAQIVSNCPKLKSLAFGAKNFLGKNYTSFFNNTDVKSILSNLKELSIGIPQKLFSKAESTNHDSDSYDDDSDEEWSSLYDMDNFTNPIEVFKLFPDLNMKLDKLCYIEPDEVKDSHFHPNLILSSSRNSLTELTLSIGINALDRLKAMKFPKLRRLTLEVFGLCDDNFPGDSEDEELNFTVPFSTKLIPFLQNHISTLTEFVLHSIGEFCLVPFCEVLKSSKKIRVLKLRGQQSFTRTLPGVKWDFLGGLSTLRYFKISMHDTEDYSDDEWISSDEEDEVANLIEDERRARNPKPTRSDNWDRYLSSLPSTVQSIGFRGFNYSGRPEDLTTVVTSQLTRFENLTALTLIVCPTFFNDDILQFICKNLNKLRILKGDFSTVSDFGISGRRDDGYNSGISLQNLTGLTKLAIHSSEHGKLQITWEGLLCSIQFLDLVKLSITALTIKDNHKDSVSPVSTDAANYIKLIGRNPSLERISLGFYQPSPEHMDQIFKVNSRIKFQSPVKRVSWGQFFVSRIN